MEARFSSFPGLHFDISIKALAFFQLADFRKALHDRDVCQVPAAVLSPQNLRLHVVQSNS